jgi:hypothetical protein
MPTVEPVTTAVLFERSIFIGMLLLASRDSVSSRPAHRFDLEAVVVPGEHETARAIADAGGQGVRGIARVEPPQDDAETRIGPLGRVKSGKSR